MQVNRIRELPQNSRIVATHTDSPDVGVFSSLSLLMKTEAYMLFFGNPSMLCNISSLQCIFVHSQVLIWDVETQPNRHAVLGAADSRPDLVHPFFINFINSLTGLLFQYCNENNDDEHVFRFDFVLMYVQKEKHYGTCF